MVLRKRAPLTIVLVHGAFADGSSWRRVISRLQNKGFKVVAVQNALTSLKDDVATTRRALKTLERVLLVGHGYGGAVISEVGLDNGVEGLVYIAGFVPTVGDSINDFLNTCSAAENCLYGDYVQLNRSQLSEKLAQDLRARELEVFAATQHPTSVSCFTEKLTNSAWSRRPTWYVVTIDDRYFQPASQRVFLGGAAPSVTQLEVKGSHLAILSKPDEVVKILSDVAQIVDRR